MILISHRGNTNGKNPEKENTVSYIQQALKKGYHCEIDLCKWDGKHFYLGHDEPGEKVSLQWLGARLVWCHAKNYKTFEKYINTVSEYGPEFLELIKFAGPESSIKLDVIPSVRVDKVTLWPAVNKDS